MTIKKRFAEKYGRHERKTSAGRLYTLAKIRDQSPVVYSADAVMKAENPRGGEESRCDDFVLCARASVAGIYIVEQKEGRARGESVEQLQAGATFMSPFVRGGRCAFLPVLVAKAIPPRLRKKLATAKIKLGNLPSQKVRHVKTGDSLPSIIAARAAKGG